MAKYLSFRQYAVHRGVSPEAVSKAVKTGRIPTVEVNGKKQIDPVAADQSWDANTTMNRAQSSSVSLEASTYQRARAARESYEAQIAKLKYEEMSGQLTRVALVKSDAFEAGRALRSALMGMSDRLAPILAVETSLPKVRSILHDEINKCLRGLTEDVEKP